MSGGARLAVGACLAALSMAAGAATPARTASAPARANAAAAPTASAAPAAASAPVEFNGLLEAGTTYVAEMAYDPRALRIWRPVKEVRVAKNVAWTIDWTNIDRFPQLKTAATQAKPQRFRFTVVKNDVVSGSPVMPWMSTYRCEILAVEPVAVAGPSTPPPKKR
jgi:pyruvate/2-oxoglutarate dehydrogenase complex dihydrolipoamide acyltransferase (E2) component